ncbi:hypothetical protein PHSY_001163 [Pseudozyma hubeiensis SY62]|uniref:Uncharacterized protein n=1 Tax=Pseudozyma hubeiensis (strain SY62) TaxID=1305764 RepID=R9NXY1_PSEHS|nr:hypothetical protein PHSY_001163 [Pseudozyma hubeiensis SY62]GAC93598.1 hypothetical protein PHSY_001163 [Pseudozyma hubeiensis SY62]
MYLAPMTAAHHVSPTAAGLAIRTKLHGSRASVHSDRQCNWCDFWQESASGFECQNVVTNAHRRCSAADNRVSFDSLPSRLPLQVVPSHPSKTKVWRGEKAGLPHRDRDCRDASRLEPSRVKRVDEHDSDRRSIGSDETEKVQ